MRDIKINVSRETRMVEINKYIIGNDGENLQGNLIFSFTDEFVNGQGRLEYIIEGQKYYALLEKNGENYQIPILSVITKKGQIDMQLVIAEGTNENEIPIFKSNIFYLNCNVSINAEIKQPDEYEQWIDIANTKLNAIDNLDIDINDSIVTIIKKDGSIKSENVRGEKGEKGDAGSIKFIIVTELPIENIDNNAIYMKPSKNNEEENIYEEYIFVNGKWESLGSASVNVNLEDYVKNTDYPTATTGGVIKIIGDRGFFLNDGGLYLRSANESDIDARTHAYRAIVPANLEYAVKSVGNGYYATEEYVDDSIASINLPSGDSSSITYIYHEGEIVTDELKTKIQEVINNAYQNGGKLIIHWNNYRSNLKNYTYQSILYPSVNIMSKPTLLYLNAEPKSYSDVYDGKTIFPSLMIQGNWNGDVFTLSALYINSTSTKNRSFVTMNNSNSWTPTSDYGQVHKKYVDKDHYENMTGYDATKTQILKNINGVLTWVDEN